MAMTLEQQRAAFAFKRVQIASRLPGEKNATKYKKLAKGAPQMIMSSGLMPVLAFLCEKGEKESSREQLYKDVSMWLVDRGESGNSVALKDIMLTLVRAEPEQYRMYTSEAISILRWIRQMAAAVIQGDD